MSEDERTDEDKLAEAWSSDSPTVIEFQPDDVAAIESLHYDEGDYAETTVYALVSLTDGRWGTVAAWCDTTGWDCQSDAEIKAWPTRDEAIRRGLDDGIRRTLGIPQPVGPMSTPDAVPVEVEGGPSNGALADQMDKEADRAHDGGYFATSTGYRLIAARLRALPAAPTTPDITDERDERERRFCHTVQLPDEDQGECEWDQCPLLTEGCCALPMPPRATAITPEDLAAMDGLIVGSMCHCDDPDDCFDHWQFFIVDDPATAMYDGEHVGQGRTLNEAQMRHLAALATPSTPGDGQGEPS